MQGLFRFLKSTLIGGLGILVPVVALGAIVVWVIKIAATALLPFFDWLPDKSVGGVSLTALFTILGLVVGCFLAGLFAETAVVRGFGERAERLALSVPGYALMKNVGASLIGVEGRHAARSVLVRFEASWQVGFHMETLTDGRHIVFIPGVPNALVGTLHIVERERVQVLAMSVSAALDGVGRLGVGFREMAPREPVAVSGTE